MKLPRNHDSLPSMGSPSPYNPKNLVSKEDHDIERTGGLSVFFAILCIVDLFGVFPIVALPKSIIACGVYGIPLVLAVFALQLYTAVLLGRCWVIAQEITPQIGEKNRYPYAAVAELAFGPAARVLVTLLIDATVFGAGVPNIIVASQNLQLFFYKLTDGEVSISYCTWMLVLGLLLCPVMWLGSPKDMKPLALMSVFIVTTVAVSTWASIIMDDISPPSIGGFLDHVPMFQDFVIAYGIIAFQFDIHPMLLTIQVDMQESNKVNRVVLSGFLITGALFAVTTGLATVRYGQAIKNNILQGLPPSIPLYLVAILVTVQLSLSSAVGNSALFQHIEDLLHVPREFGIKRCIVRSSIVAFAVFLAEAVPRFDVVMGLVGATLTGPLMFVLPPLFFLKLCYMKSYLLETDPDFPPQFQPILASQNGVGDGQQNGLSTWRTTSYKTFSFNKNFFSERNVYNTKVYDVVLASIIVLFGITTTILATYSTWLSAISTATFSPPCLANATAAARSMAQIISTV